MNNRLTALAAVAAALSIVSSAMAQPPGGPGRGMRRGPMANRGMMQSPARLLMNQAVRDDLKVTDEQTGKVREMMQSMRESADSQANRGDRPSFQDMSEEEREKFREQRREQMQKQMAEVQKKLGEILDKDQMKRLNQIRLQAMGPGILQNERVSAALKITDEQRQKMRAAMQELRPQRRGGPDAERPNPGQMREKMLATMNEVLTEEQQQTLKGILGEPFDVAQLTQGRRGQGRRGVGQGRGPQGR
jgi:Spy/CpxP family protein refolding chaperone